MVLVQAAPSLGTCPSQGLTKCQGNTVLSCGFGDYWQLCVDCGAMDGRICQNGACKAAP